MKSNKSKKIDLHLNFKNHLFFNLKNYFLMPLSEGFSIKSKLIWLIRLRWLAIAFLFIMTPIGFKTGEFLENTKWVYSSLIVFLFLFNFLSQWWWVKKNKLVKNRHVALQLIFDLFALAAFLTLTEGSLNPFYILFFINISLGATLLDGIWGLIFLALCHLSLLVVQLESSTEVRVLPAYLIQHFAMLTAWGVSRSLAKYISLQKENLYQVQIYAEKLDRLRALGAMTAGFSHEFASPLNTIKLRLNRELRANPDSKNLLDMKDAVSSCETIIYQMNSAQMDPREFQFQTFSLNSATFKIMNSWLHENPKAKASLNLYNMSDKVKLPLLNYSQALFNVLDNAFESNPESDIKITIERQNEHLIALVENEGPLFSEEVLQRFGEPFVTTKTTGTGLGLYSVQLFSQSVGGRTKISNIENGAKVEIYLPHFEEAEESL